MAPLVTMKDLLEAGVHFGHKKQRWNPKMAPYIYGLRNDIYIIDLKKTMLALRDAYAFVRDTVANEANKGGGVLFVGTKRQAKDIVREEAERCGAHYVTERWLGGMLTNFRTIRKSIDKMKKIEEMEKSGELAKFTKKEALRLVREKKKIERILSGVKDMNMLPSLIYVVDIKKAYIAVHEANILGIPVVAIVDTNCDPEQVTYPIPGNDDAIRSIQLITHVISDAVLEGKKVAGVTDEVIAEKEAE